MFEMFVIWVMILGCIIFFYEVFKCFYNFYYIGILRWRMLVFFILDIYLNYYLFWMFVNYMNDGFYK